MVDERMQASGGVEQPGGRRSDSLVGDGLGGTLEAAGRGGDRAWRGQMCRKGCDGRVDG